MSKAGELRSLSLSDGRLMSYREYGDPQGSPVINCHGGLLSGCDIAPAHSAAERLGLRLISPDRPGIGLSTPDPSRTTGAWAADVAELLADLNLSEAAAFGWSLGGQYALGLAALIPQVKHAVVVAGTPELDEELLAQLNGVDRTLVSLARRQPLLLRVATVAASGLARFAPVLVIKATEATVSPPDRAALESWPPAEFAACMTNALRQADGIVVEYQAESRPWGFALEDVSCTVTLWQGTEDQLVPPQWVDILARKLPQARVNKVPGAGHLLAYQRWDEVLSSVALPRSS